MPRTRLMRGLPLGLTRGLSMTVRESVHCAASAAILWVLAGTAAYAASEIPDFYAEPGSEKSRDLRGEHPFETIDPVSGLLNLNFTDFYLPGNGGLDIAVVRSYNNIQGNDAGAAPPHSLVGMGWDLHFGRVLLNAGVNNTSGCNLLDQVSTNKNPVLELPGGARKVLTRTESDGAYSAHRFVTKDFWIADCGTDNSFVITNPDGIQYKMTKKGRVDYDTEAWFAAEIRDTKGNTLTFTYSDNAADGLTLLKNVVASDGRRVDFTYYDENLASVRLKTAAANGRTFTYAYQPVAGVTGGDALTQVTTPWGTNWRFAYYSANETLPTLPAGLIQGGRLSLKTVTYPEGGTLNYVYQQYAFEGGAAGAYYTTGIYKKSANPVIGTAGEWAYSFDAFRSGQDYDLTTVTAPDAVYKYQHYGITDVGQGTLWKVGLLAKKEIFDKSNLATPVESYDYQYSPLRISWQNEFRPSRGLIDVGSSAALMTKATVMRDGVSFVTDYKNHTAFGLPGQIDEYKAGTASDPRTTMLEYYLNTSRWIVHRKKTETVKSAGMNYLGITLDAVTRWEFDNGSTTGPGLLTKLTKLGYSTTYSYHPSGDVQTVVDGKNNVSTYTNYKRGIPQSEALSEGVTVSRVVNDTGTIASETDGEAYTTSYAYDNQDRLKSITYPADGSSPVSVAWDDPVLGVGSRRLVRGRFTQDSKVDGFGRVVTVESKDTAAPSNYVCVKRDYDALGRMSFESYPEASCNPSNASGYGTRLTFDALGRTKTKMFAGSSDSLSYQYSNQFIGESVLTVRETNERGFSTTYSYRAFGSPNQSWLIRVDAPELIVTTLQRNKLGLLEMVTQGGVSRDYQFDNSFKLYREIHPDRASSTFTYDGNGNPATRKLGSAG